MDIGAAFINDVNYALFNNDVTQPLSVIQTNLDLGNFFNNQDGSFPIEYDGVSKLLTVIAPVQQGTNNIKIAVADTGDQAYDSGLFISNFQGTGYSGGGLAQVVEVTSGSLAQPLTVDLGNIVYQIPDTIEEISFLFNPSTTGDKTIIAGADNYLQAFFDFSVQNLLNAAYDSFNELNQTNSLTLVTPYGQQSLVGADLVLFNDAAFALDTLAGGKTWQAYALIKAAFGTGPDQTLLSQWVKAAQDVGSITELASEFLDTYAPVGFTSQDLVGHLLQVLSGAVPTQEAITNALSFLATEGYDTSEEILAYVAENIVDMSGVEGNILSLDLGFFI